MQKNLIALGVLLRELEIPSEISTLQDRMLVQKAVYLVQSVAGVDLGYRYGWYLKGPYSPSLTRDYYALDEAKAGEPSDPLSGYTLLGGISQRVTKLRAHFSVPSNVQLTRAAWLELVASIDYLRRIPHQSEDDIKQTISEKKPHLTRYLNDGFEAVRQLEAVFQD